MESSTQNYQGKPIVNLARRILNSIIINNSKSIKEKVKKNNYITQFLLLINLLLLVFSTSILADFLPPKLIDNLNSKGIQKTANMSRIEGWTLMSYIIDHNGHPQHIEVVNSSHNGKYTEGSIRYLQNLRYSPATYLGQNVLSADTFFMRHNKSVISNNNDGISVGFSLRYDRANKFISEKKFDQALEVLNDLRNTNTKNLLEQALSAWIHSLYYYHQENWLAYRDSVLEAHQLREHLPVKMAIKSTKNLFQWQVFQKEYSDAAYTLASMENIKNSKMSASTYETMLKPILNSIETDLAIEINTTLSEGKLWLHALARSNINLTTISGKVQLAELRCSNIWYPFQSTEIDNFNIPENYLNCSILVKGKPGTQIKFIEKGEVRPF